MTSPAREQQLEAAEELLGDRLQQTGFAQGLYFGRYLDDKLVAYPDFRKDRQTAQQISQLANFCSRHIDAGRIDREGVIPDEVVRGLGQLGVLGACLPTSCGGLGLSQVQYCRLIEVLGGHCGSTALFVNAHHSIGPRALVLFGNPQQQRRYLPRLASGEWLSAFALTEEEAGSDAANVQTMALPTGDGRGYLLNGQKRWITNGGLADVLTVMARTPVEGSDQTSITAFIVTPDMPGFEVTETRMEKCGVRGTATGRLAFRDMFIPRENVLGEVGKGLKIALTVLDYGRTTFGASCSGAARFCVQHALRHSSRRIQFQQTLRSFELVKKKLAYMAAGAFAIETATYETAALIDAGQSEYMVETAMLKVFSTEVLWRIINDTIQIYGGKAYFVDEPFERMMRDARINTIGEGANDVLRVFIGLAGMRAVGLELKSVLDAAQSPLSNLGKLADFAGRKINALINAPQIPVADQRLSADADRLAKTIGIFGHQVERLLRHYREDILDRQYQLERVADTATELYVSACVLGRLERALDGAHLPQDDVEQQLWLGRYYLNTARRRMERNLDELWDNDDGATTTLADSLRAGQADA
ncbi:MAG: acyl-CoA dehydrogenase [Planctomycetales bacterium]|nr:acyl-CoA dehydrogenase [Planctomycetales bacterium]NIM08143.1 acyl-CoA dehydrogenase [Planctomycetales bacterium]NIN07636.1 acyl-CoA dehydrogenase [Planctomycetales bacterium]NIN76753.1 acyl-CoA dehydrogenase [Planctomycetales bacterium]NIO33962.1 acyl-CoA dehydrogenase [Planctomycetales bacterium]